MIKYTATMAYTFSGTVVYSLQVGAIDRSISSPVVGHVESSHECSGVVNFCLVEEPTTPR